MAQTQVFGVRETLAELKKIDETLYWEAINQMKDATKPLASAVAMEFGYGSPLSGMENHNGRTKWQSPKITTKIAGRKKPNSDEWGLVKLVVAGAAAQIVDMAGRSHNGTKTRQYEWKGSKRSHRVNGQGDAMIQNLPGKPSRYIWPTAESLMPLTIRAVLKAIEETSRIINKNLVLRND